MKNIISVIAALSLALGAASGAFAVTKASAPTSASAISATSDDLSKYAAEIAELVNKERKANDLNELKFSAKLSESATVRANELPKSFSHTRPDGSSCFTAIKENNITYRSAAENIAYGQKNPEEVMNAWMNSSGHRANILNSEMEYLGVGVAYINGTYYWSQFFTAGSGLVEDTTVPVTSAVPSTTTYSKTSVASASTTVSRATTAPISTTVPVSTTSLNTTSAETVTVVTSTEPEINAVTTASAEITTSCTTVKCDNAVTTSATTEAAPPVTTTTDSCGKFNIFDFILSDGNCRLEKNCQSDNSCTQNDICITDKNCIPKFEAVNDSNGSITIIGGSCGSSNDCSAGVVCN